jgi:hypothetical protein
VRAAVGGFRRTFSRTVPPGALVAVAVGVVAVVAVAPNVAVAVGADSVEVAATVRTAVAVAVTICVAVAVAAVPVAFPVGVPATVDALAFVAVPAPDGVVLDSGGVALALGAIELAAPGVADGLAVAGDPPAGEAAAVTVAVTPSASASGTARPGPPLAARKRASMPSASAGHRDRLEINWEDLRRARALY